jgi:DNA-binding NtrC family response regulator
MRAHLQSVFAGEGLHLSFAVDEAVARKILQQGDVDLTLIDVRSNVDAGMALAEDAQLSAVKVVLLAARGSHTTAPANRAWPSVEEPHHAAEVVGTVLSSLGMTSAR